MFAALTGGFAVIGFQSCMKLGASVANTIAWGQRMFRLGHND